MSPLAPDEPFVVEVYRALDCRKNVVALKDVEAHISEMLNIMGASDEVRDYISRLFKIEQLQHMDGATAYVLGTPFIATADIVDRSKIVRVEPVPESIY